MLFVIAVHFQGLARFQWQRRLHIADQLLVAFIHANHWKTRVIRTLIHIQDLFHIGYERRVVFGRDAPLLFAPGFERIFFSTWRTVSCETAVTYSSATIRSANRRSVQRSWPVGGSPHLSA